MNALGLARCNQGDSVPADGELVKNSALYAEDTPTEENKVLQEGQYNQEFINEAETCLVQQVTISRE
ncbi:hypothetical protein ACH9D2_16885 [Kocuria sp. M4R2S49]|uniref:hypothetical protein n=1 Tax=Kocuria rhizosphaericola TaxID=3376284 RepID=UPI0037B4C0C3